MRRPVLVLVTLIVLTGGSLTTSSVFATNYYVNNDALTAEDQYTSAVGDNTNTGGSSDPFRTIQHALDQTTSGDTVFVDAVASGATFSDFSIDTPNVAVKGVGADSGGVGTVVDAGSGFSLARLNADSTRLKNVRLIGGATDAGVHIRSGSNVVVKHSVIRGNSGMARGIYVSGGSNARITQNKIIDPNGFSKNSFMVAGDYNPLFAYNYVADSPSYTGTYDHAIALNGQSMVRQNTIITDVKTIRGNTQGYKIRFNNLIRTTTSGPIFKLDDDADSFNFFHSTNKSTIKNNTTPSAHRFRLQRADTSPGADAIPPEIPQWNSPAAVWTATDDVKLDWKEVTTNLNGSPLSDFKEYRIYRLKNDTSVNWKTDATVVATITDRTTTEWTDSTVTRGELYQYRITAVDDAKSTNRSDYENESFFNRIIHPPTKFYVNDDSLSGDVYTSAVGDPTNIGSSSAPWRWLTNADSFVQPGDTVFVDVGTYGYDDPNVQDGAEADQAGFLNIHQNGYTIIGADSTPSGTVFDSAPIRIQSDGVTIKNIRHTRGQCGGIVLNKSYKGLESGDIPDDTTPTGIALDSVRIDNVENRSGITSHALYYNIYDNCAADKRSVAKNSTIKNSVVENVTGDATSRGIRINSDSFVIKNNTIRNNDKGIETIEGVDNLRVINNHVHNNNGRGIDIAPTVNTTLSIDITGNRVEGNRPGIRIYKADGTTIKNNIITANSLQGIIGRFDGTVINNTVTANTGAGLKPANGGGNWTIKNNLIKQNKSNGVRLSSVGSRHTVKHNLIKNNATWDTRTFQVHAKTFAFIAGNKTVAGADHGHFQMNDNPTITRNNTVGGDTVITDFDSYGKQGDRGKNWWQTTNRTTILSRSDTHPDQFRLTKVDTDPSADSVSPEIPGPVSWNIGGDTGSVTLTWEEVTQDADGTALSGFKEYRIYRLGKNDLSDPDWKTNATVVQTISDKTTTSWTDNSVDDLSSNKYAYRLTAVDDAKADGRSLYENESFFTPVVQPWGVPAISHGETTPQIRYTLNESAGAGIAQDQVHDVNGTWKNSPEAGKPGLRGGSAYALQKADDDYVKTDVDARRFLGQSGDVSVLFWVQLTDNSSAQFLASSSNAPEHNSWGLGYSGSSNSICSGSKLFFEKGGLSNIQCFGASIPTGSWELYGISYDASADEVHVFRNGGTKILTYTDTEGLNLPERGAFSFGTFVDKDGNPFLGANATYDEYRIYNRYVDGSQVQTVYDNWKPLPPAWMADGETRAVHYPLNESPSDTVAYDSMIHDNHASYVRPADSGFSGVHQAAYNFPTTDSPPINTPLNLSEINSTSDITMSFWVHPKSGTNDNVILSTIYSLGGSWPSDQWMIGHSLESVQGFVGTKSGRSATDRIGILTGDSTSSNPSKLIVSEGTIPSNTWTHVSIVYDGSANDYTIYFDGVKDSTISFSTNNGGFNAKETPTIGHSEIWESLGAPPHNYEGKLDEVVVNDAPLTKNQIQAQMDDPYAYYGSIEGGGGGNGGSSPPDTYALDVGSETVTTRPDSVSMVVNEGDFPDATKATITDSPTGSCVSTADQWAKKSNGLEIPPGLQTSVYKIEPETQPNGDVRVRFTYNEGSLRSTDIQQLKVYRLIDGECQWSTEDVSDYEVLEASNQIAFTVPRFSTFRVLVVGGVVPADLSGFTVVPNPYNPNDGNPATGQPYDGSLGTGITFANVPNNTHVEVYTLLNGELVTETETSTGGDLTWDARNESGQLVSSGWYLYKVKDRDDGTVKTGKLAVIR